MFKKIADILWFPVASEFPPPLSLLRANKRGHTRIANKPAIAWGQIHLYQIAIQKQARSRRVGLIESWAVKPLLKWSRMKRGKCFRLSQPFPGFRSLPATFRRGGKQYG